MVHCHGWFSAIAPIYLKKVFDDDPVFRDVKVVVSVYGDRFDKPLGSQLRKVIEGEGVADENLSIIDEPTYENLFRYVIGYADGIVIGSPKVNAETLDVIRAAGKPVLEYRSPDEEGFFDNYNRFYEELH